MLLCIIFYVIFHIISYWNAEHRYYNYNHNCNYNHHHHHHRRRRRHYELIAFFTAKDYLGG